VIRRILVLSTFLLVAMTGTAFAQYVPGEPGIIVDPGTVQVGGTIEVQGSGCPRDTTVSIYVGDTLVATTTTAADDGTGSFDVKGIVLPPSLGPGDYIVHARCGTLDLTSVLSISAVAPTTTVATTGTLPTTGSNSTGLLVPVGVGLVAVGGLVVLATRRRRLSV
jgi:LPXTG-motif cell wall-anchored protein